MVTCAVVLGVYYCSTVELDGCCKRVAFAFACCWLVNCLQEDDNIFNHSEDEERDALSTQLSTVERK